jgi:hypothetical protein
MTEVEELRKQRDELIALCKAFAKIFLTAKLVSTGRIVDTPKLQQATEDQIDAAMAEYKRLIDEPWKPRLVN